jgi:hypothetical protein
MPATARKDMGETIRSSLALSMGESPCAPHTGDAPSQGHSAPKGALAVRSMPLATWPGSQNVPAWYLINSGVWSTLRSLAMPNKVNGFVPARGHVPQKRVSACSGDYNNTGRSLEGAWLSNVLAITRRTWATLFPCTSPLPPLQNTS